MECCRVNEVGMVLGHAFLKERFSIDALGEALEHHGAPSRAAQRTVRDCEVIVHEIELGQPGLGEHHLVRVGDADLVAGDVEDLCRGLRRVHAATLAMNSPPSQSCRGERQRNLVGMKPKIP